HRQMSDRRQMSWTYVQFSRCPIVQIFCTYVQDICSIIQVFDRPGVLDICPGHMSNRRRQMSDHRQMSWTYVQLSRCPIVQVFWTYVLDICPIVVGRCPIIGRCPGHMSNFPGVQDTCPGHMSNRPGVQVSRTSKRPNVQMFKHPIMTKMILFVGTSFHWGLGVGMIDCCWFFIHS